MEGEAKKENILSIFSGSSAQPSSRVTNLDASSSSKKSNGSPFLINVPSNKTTQVKRIPFNGEKKNLLRVKRKRDDPAQEIFVVSNPSDKDKSKPPKVFKLLKTIEAVELSDLNVSNKEVHKTLLDIIKNKPKTSTPPRVAYSSIDQVHTKISNLKNSHFDKRRATSTSARFEVVNRTRYLPESDDEDDHTEAKIAISVYEVIQDEIVPESSLVVAQLPEIPSTGAESDITLNLNRLFREKLTIEVAPKDDDFVIDLYEIDEEDGELPLGTIQPGATLQWLKFDSDSEMGEEDTDEEFSDDVDSNAEDHYANDYPEEEEFDETYNYEAYDSADDSDELNHRKNSNIRGENPDFYGHFGDAEHNSDSDFDNSMGKVESDEDLISRDIGDY